MTVNPAPSASRSARLGPPARRHRGFTLIELLFVVATTLIIIAIALPRFPTFLRTYKLRNDARALAELLSAARMLGSENCKRSMVTCNETSKLCQIELRGLSDTTFQPTTASRQVVLSGSNIFGPPGTVGAGSPNNTSSQAVKGVEQCDNIVFNSRGLPIYDSSTGAATTACNTNVTTDGGWVYNYVNYINDGQGGAIAIVVDPSGKANLYSWSATANQWTAIQD